MFSQKGRVYYNVVTSTYHEETFKQNGDNSCALSQNQECPVHPCGAYAMKTTDVIVLDEMN